MRSKPPKDFTGIFFEDENRGLFYLHGYSPHDSGYVLKNDSHSLKVHIITRWKEYLVDDCDKEEFNKHVTAFLLGSNC